MKKICVSIMTLALIFTLIPNQTSFVEVQAAENNIEVTNTNNKLTIGNEYMTRVFDYANNGLRTESIVNKRTGGGETVFHPAEGSEEFKIKTTKTETPPISAPALDRSEWTAVADSYQNENGPSDGNAPNLIDGDINSIWHTNYGGGIGSSVYPYNVVFNLNKEETFQSFSYTPRKEGEDVNGNISGYELYVATSDEKLEVDSTEWTKVSEGNFKYSGTNPIFVNLDSEVSANQVKFVALSAKNGQAFAGGAEFNLHSEKVDIPTDNREFKTSDLTLKENGVQVEDTSATINKVEKTGKKVTFAFEPYEYNGVTYTINQVIVMYTNDHFMRKYLEISVPNEQSADASIDYIDLESLKVNDSDATWTVPTDAGGVVEMSQFKANLGQPIYIQGMFFGCEFPVADTQIVDNTGYMRYYSGKSFDRLRKDNQLTNDTNAAKYVTWQTVAGAARSTENEVIQSDFFEYIHSISTPSEFRTQYNSWFDNMMLIDDENILNSFIEMDRELSKVETRPLDSYVVDDGWINYNDTYVVDANRAGTTLNETGFWEFNSKFPQGLTPSSQLVQNFGSNFGVWVGPRGGYNFYGHLANIIAKSGKGSKAGGSIDVADRVYVENLTNMFVDWQKEYQVNYWKWDGFADRAQYGAFSASDGVPGYSESNRHMYGGYENMYHVSDLWEAWIDLFEKVRQSEDELGINKLWLSLTCYVNPSPWFLQWANSVWLQCTADQADAGPSSSKMDRQLTYRDACYYDFLKKHEFQFPLSNIYNHDPVYGKEGTGMTKNTATDEQFQNYLYMLAARGTSFWELYYSDSIMSEGKYEITGEFLEWAETNYHILKNAKMIGGHPNQSTALGGGSGLPNANEAYGYSSFDGSEGILSLRNPSNVNKTITFTLDRTMGAPENVQTFNYHLEHTYNTPADLDQTGTFEYGKEYSITLQPDEVRVIKISENGDTTAPKMIRAFSDGSNKISIKFNEKVNGNDFSVKGAIVKSVEKSADGITYHITLEKELANNATIEVSANDIKDLANNVLTAKNVSFKNFKDNLVVNKEMGKVNGQLTLTDASNSLKTNHSFSVNAHVNTTQTNKVLVEQANGYVLGIDANGNAYVSLNGATATSKVAINDGKEHMITGVKENNGILKIYVDGNLSSSAYRVENRYFTIGENKITLGSEGFDGELGASVYSTGLGYDAVKALLDPVSPDRQPLDTKDMEVSVSGTSEGNAGDIFDNDPTSFWTSESAEGGIQQGDPNLTIDLKETKLVDRVDYTKRFHNGPENYWKCTGNLLDYIIEVSEDGENWTKVSSGATVEDATSTSIKEGGTTAIEFTPVVARYVRISGTKSYHWQPENTNKFMTVADLAIYGEAKENKAFEKTAKATYTDGSDVAVNKDKPLEFMVDGDKGINSYTDFGSDGVKKSAYVEVDLENLVDISAINLFRYFADGRTYNGTVIAVSKDADFKEKTIVYNSDAENVHGLGTGTDALYAENASGKTISLSAAVSGRYVRIYMHGSNKGTTNHIVELEVMGFDSEVIVDKSALEQRIAELEALSTEDCLATSVETFKALINEAKTVVEVATSQEAIDTMILKLANAEQKLVSIKALNEVLENARKASMKYTVSSFVPVKELIQVAEQLLEKDATQEEVDKLSMQLETALNADTLVLRGNIIVVADALAKYADLKEEDYTKKTWEVFTEVKLEAMNFLFDFADVSQEDVDQMAIRLEVAVANLKKVTPEKPDPKPDNPNKPDPKPDNPNKPNPKPDNPNKPGSKPEQPNQKPGQTPNEANRPNNSQVNQVEKPKETIDEKDVVIKDTTNKEDSKDKNEKVEKKETPLEKVDESNNTLLFVGIGVLGIAALAAGLYGLRKKQ